MSVRLRVAEGSDESGEDFQVEIVDRTADPMLYGSVRLSSDLIRSDHDRALLHALTHEIAGALHGIDSRRKNRPEVGALVVHDDGEPQRIVAVDRTANVVRLAHDSGRPGVAVEPDWVPWSECRYAS